MFSSNAKTNLTEQQKRYFEMVSSQPNFFLANLRALNLKMTHTVFAVQKCLIFGKKGFFFQLFSLHMILTDDYNSQSKIVETPQFIFKPTNFGLSMKKYNFFFNNYPILSL